MTAVSGQRQRRQSAQRETAPGTTVPGVGGALDRRAGHATPQFEASAKDSRLRGTSLAGCARRLERESGADEVEAVHRNEQNPLGVGGLELYQWVFPLKEFSDMHGGDGGETNTKL